jgi:AraC-like DNA-binding protein
LLADDHRIPYATPHVFAPTREFLSFLAMSENLALPSLADGRVVRHVAGDRRPRPHRHAELEVNLVVRGTASYLLSERRYELTPGTLTWLFPGQEHVLVDESRDHELWWAVFRPALVARTATTTQMRRLLEKNPAGEYSRRLDSRRARRLDGLLGELCAAEQLDHALLNAGLAYLLVVAWRAFLDSDDVIEGVEVHPAVQTVAHLLRADPEAGDLTTLAGAAGLSPSHLSRLFRAQTGVTISRFRNQQRLRRFDLLYRDGRHTTALAAALQAGFGSYAQFYRVFRNETGHRPSLSRDGRLTAAAGPR